MCWMYLDDSDVRNVIFLVEQINIIGFVFIYLLPLATFDKWIIVLEH